MTAHGKQNRKLFTSIHNKIVHAAIMARKDGFLNGYESGYKKCYESDRDWLKANKPEYKKEKNEKERTCL